MKSRIRRPFLFAATLILLLAAFFRLWHLGTVPPGLLVDELHNAQLADRMRAGDMAVVYDQVVPGREGFYYALLAVTTTLFGRGLILWRLPSVWLSLLGLSVTFSLMRRLLNGRAALLVIALMGVTFWPVWLGRAVLHVTLMPLVTAAFAYMMTRAFAAQSRQEAGLWFAVAGIGLGVAQYIHVTAWGLLLILAGFVVYLMVTHPEVVRRNGANIVYALVLAAVIFAPLFVFILNHPGVRAPVPLADQPDWLAQVPERLARSVGGLFLRGDSSPNRNLPFRPAMDPFVGILFVVGLGVTIARFRRSAFAVLPIWLLLGLVPALLVPHVPHFEYMALVLPVVFAFPALALDEIHGLLRERPPALLALGVFVALIVASNAAWTFRDAFLRWPHGGDVRFNYQADVASLAHYLDTSADPSPVGLCVTPPDETDDPFALSSDRLLGYFMHRSTLPVRKFDCRQTLVLAERGASQRLIFLPGHYYDDLPGPLLGWLRYGGEVNIPGVPPGVVRRVEAAEELGTFLQVTSGAAPVAWPPEASGGPGPASLPATFTDNLVLEGYEVRDATLLPGDAPEVTTYWRLTGPPPHSLTLFAQLQSGPGQVVALSEEWGADLDTVQPDDIIIQYNLLQPVQADPLESGEYRLVVGLAVPGTEHRLRVLDGNRIRSDRLFLQRVQVVD